MLNKIKRYLDNLSSLENKEEQKVELIKIYSVIYGYYSALKENDKHNLLNKDDIIVEIDTKLQTLLDVSISNILTSGKEKTRLDNILQSINKLYQISVDKETKDRLCISITSFLEGYDYYNENYGKLYIISNFLGLGKKKELKLLELKNKTDTYN